MEELKWAVHVSEEEREEMRTAGNPLLSLLDDFKYYEPTQPAVRSPVIEEVVAEKEDDGEGSNKEKGDELEEVDEEIKVDEPEAAVDEKPGPSRSDKGKEKMVEEEVPAEKRMIYLEELSTAIPIDELQFNFSQTFEREQPKTEREAEEMDFESEGERDWMDEYFENIQFLEEQGGIPTAEGVNPVQSGNGNAGADGEDEEMEQEGGVAGGGELEEMDRPGNPKELAASIRTYDA